MLTLISLTDRLSYRPIYEFLCPPTVHITCTLKPRACYGETTVHYPYNDRLRSISRYESKPYETSLRRQYNRDLAP